MYDSNHFDRFYNCAIITNEIQPSRKSHLPTPSESSRRSSVTAHHPHIPKPFASSANPTKEQNHKLPLDSNSPKPHFHSPTHSHDNHILPSIEEEEMHANNITPLDLPENLDPSTVLQQVDQAMIAQDLDDMDLVFTLAYEGLNHTHPSGQKIEENTSGLPSSIVLKMKERKCRLTNLTLEAIELKKQKAKEEKMKRKMEQKKKAERKTRRCYVTRLGREKEARALEQQAILWYGSSVLEIHRRSK